MTAPAASSYATAPRVRVILVTYNHDKFIAQAIESILMQEVNFAYEIVILEDCSTDRTREIVSDYQRKYPEKIQLRLATKNENDNRAFADAIRFSETQYIALLDGDDYWKSPHKLQKQVDFLDIHPECAVCFHNVTVIYEDPAIEPHPFYMPEPKFRLSKKVPKPLSTLADIIQGNFIQTCSVLFRAGFVKEFPAWYDAAPMADWPLHVLNAHYGSICYLEETLSVYRVHAGGLWSMNMSLYRRVEDVEKVIRLYENLNRHLSFKYSKAIHEELQPLYYEAARLLLETKMSMQAIRYATLSLFPMSTANFKRQKILLYLLLRAYVPHLLRAIKVGGRG